MNDNNKQFSLLQQRGDAMNVLWITCDEMKANALSVYGNKGIKLPAMERLASEGVVFEKNFVQVPKCIPSRPSMLTGRYAHVDGLRAMSTECFKGNGWMTLNATAPSLITWLKKDGYKIDIFGKNHWIRHEAENDLLDRKPESIQAKTQPPLLEVEPPEIMQRAYFAGRVSPEYDRETFSDSVSVDRTIRFMEQNRNEPFFALLDIGQPHPPYYEWPEFADDIPLDLVPVPPCRPLTEMPMVEQAIRRTFDVEDLSDDQRRRIVRAYWSQCRFADNLVGRVLDAIERLGLVEETLVIYNADHGDFAGEHNCYEKWDTALLDCITQVPLVMRLPGVISKNKRIEELTEQVDITPTILEALAKAIPDSIQGKSLLALIKGETDIHKDAVFSQGGVESCATQKPGLDYQSKLRKPYWNKQKTLIDYPEALMRSHMVRTKEHKLIYRLNGEHEFYDLTKDPEELNNVYGHADTQDAIVCLEKKLLHFFVKNQNDMPQIDELWA
jgi:arylsulfatase A-like enzyme